VTEAYERRNERWAILLAANQRNEGAQLYTALVSTSAFMGHKGQATSASKPIPTAAHCPIQ